LSVFNKETTYLLKELAMMASDRRNR